MFKRGDVVQDNERKWIGVVESSSSLIAELFGQWKGDVIWFEGEGAPIGCSTGCIETDVTKIDGYEFEAALYLQDTDRLRQLYTNMKQQRDQAIIMAVPELHRRYTFTLKLGADSTRDIDGALNSIQYDLIVLTKEQELNRSYHSISGGPSAGWSVDIQFDPEMTHDRYFEQLDAYLEQKRGN